MSETIEQKCIAKGVKLTDQRKIIAKVMSNSEDHPDVNELYLRVSKLDSKISIATVYRTVKLFEEAGIITKHDFKGGKARYEEVSESHHDHLIDIKTGEIIEFVDEDIEILQKKVAEKYGYNLVDHKLELYGIKKKSWLMSKKIFIKTLGCQMNEYDSNRIYDSVKRLGFEKSQNQNNLDCYVLNTCHIRDKAKEKVYHDIGRVKKLYKKKNKPIIVVAGCVAQAENQEMLNREPYIDIVIGPQSYHKINDKLKNFIKGNKIEETEFDTVSKFNYFDNIENKNNKIEETEFDTVSKFNYFDNIENENNKISSYLTIQEGCDKFCSFCVVPYTRGPEYSRPFNKIISEAEELIKNGTKEIILLGQNVNAYSFKEKIKEYRISDLINKLETYSELKRIRYTTSHPRDMTDDLIECYSTSKKLMPLVHLPIQSGSNKILKLMNRKHTVEKYIEIYEKLIKINPKIEFSSDFIIAYPGETENDFNETLDLVKKIKFINSFSFIFSPRPGTVASNLDQIDNKIAKERLLKIQEYLFKFQLKKNESFINKSIDVLVENEMVGQNKLFGRNQYMNSVIFKEGKNFIGKNVNIKIEQVNQNSLFGKIEKNNMRAA